MSKKTKGYILSVVLYWGTIAAIFGMFYVMAKEVGM